MSDTTLDRKSYLGSSDIAAVLGLSPWRTPLDVWRNKVGESDQVFFDPQRERMFRRGKLMEPVVIQMMIEERGLEVTDRNVRYRDTEFPYMAAEIDAEGTFEGEQVNVEVKTSHPFAAAKWGEEGTDEIPIEYACQAMFGLMIRPKPRTIFGVLIGSDNLLLYRVVRDEQMVKAIRERARQFWEGNVLKGIPPEPQDIADVQYLFRKKQPSRIEASPEVAQAARELARLREIAKSMEEQENALKFQIGAYMLGAESLQKNDKPGQHVLTVDGMEYLSVSLQSTSRIDVELLRKEFPDQATKCSKTTQSYVYRFKRSKS